MESHFAKNVLQIKNPTQEDIRILLEYLSETSTSIEVELIADDEKECWDILKKECPLIIAAGGLIKNQKNELLFIFRNGLWDLPKGKCEKEENTAECALREIAEECGFDELNLGKELPSTYHIYFYKNSFVLKKTHWFEITTNYKGEFKPETKEGIEKVQWFSKENLHVPLSNTYRSIKDFVQKLDD